MRSTSQGHDNGWLVYFARISVHVYKDGMDFMCINALLLSTLQGIMVVKADVEGKRKVRSVVLHPTGASRVALLRHCLLRGAGGVVNSLGNKCRAGGGTS